MNVFEIWMQPCMFSVYVDVDVYEYDEYWCIWMQPCMFSVYVDVYECNEYWCSWMQSCMFSLYVDVYECDEYWCIWMQACMFSVYVDESWMWWILMCQGESCCCANIYQPAPLLAGVSVDTLNGFQSRYWQQGTGEGVML